MKDGVCLAYPLRLEWITKGIKHHTAQKKKRERQAEKKRCTWKRDSNNKKRQNVERNTDETAWWRSSVRYWFDDAEWSRTNKKNSWIETSQRLSYLLACVRICTGRGRRIEKREAAEKPRIAVNMIHMLEYNLDLHHVSYKRVTPC
jgi:hypothetical protein